MWRAISLVLIALLSLWSPHVRADDAALDCPVVLPPNDKDAKTGAAAVAGTPTVRMDILPATRWAPEGGEVQFRLVGLAAQPTHLSVFFIWQDAQGLAAAHCVPSNWVHLTSVPDPNVSEPVHDYAYAARVPRLGEPGFPWSPGIRHRSWGSAVPMAEMFVHGTVPATAGTPADDFIAPAPVGITTPWVALLLALLGLAAAWVLLRALARLRGVPGGPLLSFISTPGGVASLSQLQVLIWTGVIGVGVAYVMMLSGNLIDIPATTLGLLGVSGSVLVGSRLAGQKSGTAAASVPGAVSGLAVAGTPAATAASLNWTGPGDPPGNSTLTVQLRLSGAGTWDTVAGGVQGPPCTLSGLNPSTDYDARVFAAGVAGAGAPSTVTFTTAAAVAGAGVPPPMPQGVTAVPAGERVVRVDWPAMRAATILVQYRPARTLPWITYSTDMAAPVLVGGLTPGTSYEFQVQAIAAGVAGTPSAVARATTAPRAPLWSDLIMSDADALEVDVGRLQMLVFTTIAAIFTALTLFQSGQIPDIPDGVLGLVTLSNGIYLAHKISRRG